MKKVIAFVLSILVTLIGCQNGSKEKNNNMDNVSIKTYSLSPNIKKQLGISDELILPMDTLGMDSIFKEYKRYMGVTQDDECDDEIMITERGMSIYIPYAFNDLLKRGFKPISSEQYIGKLKEIGLAPEQIKNRLFFYEHKHYFTCPSDLYGWSDYAILDGIDEKEKEYMKYSTMNIFLIKGYNFIALSPIEDFFIKKIRSKFVFRLNDEMIHLNKFLFNNNKASLTWLQHKDPLTLRDLLISYGYDKNEVINRLILDEIKKNVQTSADISKLQNTFVRKIYAKKPYIDIREGLLKTLLKLPVNENNREWTYILDEYGYAMLLHKPQPPYSWIEEVFTKYERYKIAAYIGYYLYKLQQKYDSPPTFYAHEIFNNDEFFEYVKNNHYFNLSGFKEISDSVFKESVDNYEIQQARELHRQDME